MIARILPLVSNLWPRLRMNGAKFPPPKRLNELERDKYYQFHPFAEKKEEIFNLCRN
jgi:hypothetical protein